MIVLRFLAYPFQFVHRRKLDVVTRRMEIAENLAISLDVSLSGARELLKLRRRKIGVLERALKYMADASERAKVALLNADKIECD